MLQTLALSVAGGAACTPGSSCCVRHPRVASCSPSKSRTTQLTRPPRKEATQDGKRTACGWATGCCRRKPVECRDASHLRIAPTPSHTHCPAGGGAGATCCAGTPVHMRIGKTGSKSITLSKPSRLSLRLSLRTAGSPKALVAPSHAPRSPRLRPASAYRPLGAGFARFWPVLAVWSAIRLGLALDTGAPSRSSAGRRRLAAHRPRSSTTFSPRSCRRHKPS